MRAVIESAFGMPNGTRTLFRTSMPYISGSVRVFVNGLLMRRDFEDGWSELGDRKVQTKLALDPSDVMQFYYIPI